MSMLLFKSMVFLKSKTALFIPFLFLFLLKKSNFYKNESGFFQKAKNSPQKMWTTVVIKLFEIRNFYNDNVIRYS